MIKTIGYLIGIFVKKRKIVLDFETHKVASHWDYISKNNFPRAVPPSIPEYQAIKIAGRDSPILPW